MSSENTVKAQPYVFGTAGTSTQVTVGGATPTTNTSNPQAMARQDFSFQPTVFTTGTSGCLATVVLQATDDDVAWFAISSSTASATSAAAGTAVTNATAGVSLTGQRVRATRAVVTLTGTGSGTVFLGS